MIQSKEGLPPLPSSRAYNGALDLDEENSGPYIPISECYTGKPLSMHHKGNTKSIRPDESANYDIPRTSCFTKVPITKPASNSSGRHTHQAHHHHHHQQSKSSTLRPSSKNSTNPATRNAFPTESSIIPSRNRASIRSCGPTMDSTSSSTYSTASYGKHSPTAGYANDETNTQRCPTPNDYSYYNCKNNGSRIHEPPPRPPKPLKLNSRGKSESCSSLPGTNSLGESKSYLMEGQPESSGSAATTTISPFSQQPFTLDDTYDFPKSEPVPFTSLRTTIPAPNRASKGASNNNNSYSYTNAPPGHRSKAPVFTYEPYKGALPIFQDEPLNTLESENCDRSPLTPNSGFDSLSSNGSFSKSLTPPAVNRDLKPRRKGSDSDANSSPTSPTFTLSPPPTHIKHHQQPMAKPRHLNETPPRVPSRGRQFPFHHNRDPSASDDDGISLSSTLHKRNPSNDEQSRRAFTVPGKSPSDSDGVTYLDLDLQESENSSSNPWSSSTTGHHKSTLNHSKDANGITNGSESTVYKKIDFVATEAIKLLKISSHRTAEGSKF